MKRKSSDLKVHIASIGSCHPGSLAQARIILHVDLRSCLPKIHDLPLEIETTRLWETGHAVHSTISMRPLIVGSGVSKILLDSSDREPSTVNAGPSDAEKPFDASAKADIILRSSDSVDFFVLKAILCLASPVFDSMFSITQESKDEKSANEMKNGLPVVDLEEDSTTLYNLLILLYPYAKEPTDTLEVYTRVAEAAQKYAMDETLQKLKKLVMSCGTMVEEPVATFAVAMHFGWVEVMREAALNTLAIPLRDLITGDGQSKYLHFISAADHRDLLSWRFVCRDVLEKTFASWTTNDADYIRHIFGPHLRKRLRQTGCPRSTVLMDNRFVSDAITAPVFKEFSLWGYISAREEMMKDIENALSKVPLKISGIVVQDGD